jgi:hypothetical protein
MIFLSVLSSIGDRTSYLFGGKENVIRQKAFFPKDKFIK